MAKDDKLEERASSKRVGALRGLVPFLAPYRGMTVLALLALVVTAGMSLMLPLAVRRVVDGFNEDVALLDQYFGAALGIAALLAIGTGVRYYFVTKLGERVVADIRRALFDRVMGMSPAFFERLLTGEVLSRITTDTTLILSLIGSSARPRAQPSQETAASAARISSFFTISPACLFRRSCAWGYAPSASAAYCAIQRLSIQCLSASTQRPSAASGP